MHIEKNICDNIVGMLLCINKKFKDMVKARLDLQDMGIREELYLERPEQSLKITLHIILYHCSSVEVSIIS